mmetsp:Transcript_54118/g.124604  ORF Transcript_54118/g.124604 Transcript_54118/m.124604 type:complete len:233 (-) Transcript_54118:98-796(-)
MCSTMHMSDSNGSRGLLLSGRHGRRDVSRRIRFDRKGGRGRQVEVVGRAHCLSLSHAREEERRVVLHSGELGLEIGFVDVVRVVRAGERVLHLFRLFEQIGHIILQVLHLVDVDRLELLLQVLVRALHRLHRVGRLLEPLLRKHDLLHIELLVHGLLFLPLVHLLLLENRQGALLHRLLGWSWSHLLHLLSVARQLLVELHDLLVEALAPLVHRGRCILQRGLRRRRFRRAE